MAKYITMGSAKQFDETMDDENDEKDDTKRKSRNLSEKKRRDQFNMLVNELGSMVSANTRKMDKSTVLKSTILFLKNHNEIAVKSRVHEIQEDWKPSFLSNEEFTHLILEALDGFIMVFSSNGRIYYASESVTSLLGYLPSELENATIYEITYQDDQSLLYNVLLNPGQNRNQHGVKEENQVSFTCHIKRGGLDFREDTTYELVQFIGYFRSDTDIESLIPNNRFGSNVTNDTKLVFVGTGRLQTPQLIRDMSFVDNTKSEFTSRHSLEWKFLFLDHRAPPIIGYLPFEVLGTSGYDYYHVDDLDKVVTCHESLMQKGEGTSCHYRFLTKGQQWIWLQTRFYIDYNQWNSKPEFIVCTHNVVSYTDVVKYHKKDIDDDFGKNQGQDQSQNHSENQNQNQSQKQGQNQETNQQTPRLQQTASTCHIRFPEKSPKSSKPLRPVGSNSRRFYPGEGSDSTLVSINSQSSIQSVTQTDVPAKHHRPPEVDQSCGNFVEPQRFATEPILSVVSPGFAAPPNPARAISLPSTVLVNQQNIVMTTAQNHMQSELQRKHEELQQLIVHQQEELRRVSEQLLIARYGILSPLINVSLPYNVNLCQQPAGRCDPSPSNEVTESIPTDSVPGINPIPSSMTLPQPVIAMETFPHSAAIIPIPPSSIEQPQVNVAAIPMIPQQQQQQHQHQQIQSHEQHQNPHQQPQPIHPENPTAQMQIPLQICAQNTEMIYGNVESAPSGQR